MAPVAVVLQPLEMPVLAPHGDTRVIPPRHGAFPARLDSCERRQAPWAIGLGIYFALEARRSQFLPVIPRLEATRHRGGFSRKRRAWRHRWRLSHVAFELSDSNLGGALELHVGTAGGGWCFALSDLNDSANAAHALAGCRPCAVGTMP